MVLVLSATSPLSIVWFMDTQQCMSYNLKGVCFSSWRWNFKCCDEWPLVVFYLLFCRDLACVRLCICLHCVRVLGAEICVCMHMWMHVCNFHHIFKYVLAKVQMLHFLPDSCKYINPRLPCLSESNTASHLLDCTVKNLPSILSVHMDLLYHPVTACMAGCLMFLWWWDIESTVEICEAPRRIYRTIVRAWWRNRGQTVLVRRCVSRFTERSPYATNKRISAWWLCTCIGKTLYIHIGNGHYNKNSCANNTIPSSIYAFCETYCMVIEHYDNFLGVVLHNIVI